MAIDVPQLLAMTTAQLDALFKNSPAGDIPDGDAQGTALIATGTPISPDIAEIINLFGWQGKVFDAKDGTLINKILVAGHKLIIAKVYKGPSWIDGKECIVLDYSQTSLVAHRVRDEIRNIGPRLYMGPVYWDKDRLIHFSLQFPAG
jgi:hypothetical protein